MERIAILGSTGSIGINALKVIRRHGSRYKVAALSANSNTGLLYRQAKEFRVPMVCVNEEASAKKLCGCPGASLRVFSGESGLLELLEEARIDKLVLAISGSAALLPLLKAIDTVKAVALANKEALVMAGPLVMEKARKNGVEILPVDSELSAIWQCLRGSGKNTLKNIYLTASGGPFRSLKKREFGSISVKRALKHPRWQMGKKITIDSATLMNKGLEVLETMNLFGVGVDRIKVVIHPQSAVHSMVEFVDGAVMAQLSVTDMRIPIQYALTYPERLKADYGFLDFCKLKRLDFEEPDLDKFPCLGLAFRAARQGGSAAAVLNAANEVAVAGFLEEKINFVSIPRLCARVMDKHKPVKKPGLGEIMQADCWARSQAGSLIRKGKY